MAVKVSDVIAQFLADQKIQHVFTRLGYTEIVCVHTHTQSHRGK